MYLVKHLPFRLMEPVSKLPTPSVAIETRPPTISTASPTLKKKEFRRSFSFKNLISGPHQFCDGQNILQPGRPPHRPHVDGRYQTWGKTWICFADIDPEKKNRENRSKERTCDCNSNKSFCPSFTEFSGLVGDLEAVRVGARQEGQDGRRDPWENNYNFTINNNDKILGAKMTGFEQADHNLSTF